MSVHRLAVPLPESYASDAHDGYSFFSSSFSHTTSTPQGLQTYLNDLCTFLRQSHLIQQHPSTYFEYASQDPRVHQGDHVITPDDQSAELVHTLRLCESFAPLLSIDSLGELRALVRNGPPADGSCDELRKFYMATRHLMLSRARRQTGDSARVTLLTPEEQRACEPAPSPTQPEEQRRLHVLRLVLAHGMNPKKQHEVSVMRAAIADLVMCCSYIPPGGGDARPHEPVRTVINVGEGKGYVSRAVALCDGLQVVGLDCNPAHKERAVERVELLLERSLGTHDGVLGGDMVHLLYQPRGYVTSIVCRVGELMDWRRLLQGHVRTVSDAGTEQSPACEELSSGDAALTAADDAAGARSADYVVCRLCRKPTRGANTAVILKHIHSHLSNNVVGEASDRRGPTRAEVEQWSRELPQHEYVRRLVSIFYAAADEEGPVGPLKRGRRPSSVTNASDAVEDARLQPIQIARGYRAVVCTVRGSHTSATPPAGEAADTRAATSPPEQLTLTVVGFNAADDRHQVVFDDRSCKENYRLFKVRAAAGADADASALCFAPPARWADEKKAVVLFVLPLVAPSTPEVRVPSLSNTVMVGLHPCGDLGANICRLFGSSGARGLLLVSCCWHALSHAGFPLSEAVRRRGMDIDRLSLQLATQPLDMWSTASPAGHRSSTKIHFFRSLLHLLWRHLKARWSARGGPQQVSCAWRAERGQPCGFAPLPHLEPAFLRRIARVKESITFEGFVAEVCRAYIFRATAKSSAYTWETEVCEACRRDQEEFFVEALEDQSVAAMGTRYFNEHFARFVGLTVLRIWMCHLVETLFLLDRALYLHETLARSAAPNSAVSLVPLFEGAISPRMYGIFVRRW